MKEYITKITSNGIMTHKSFWKIMRPFLTNKGLILGKGISLFEEEKLVNNGSIVAQIHVSYINVAGKTSEIKPTVVLDHENTNMSKAIDIFVDKYI